MSVISRPVAEQEGLKKLQKEYYHRLQRIRVLQQNLETQQRGLFEFISANQTEFNKLYMTMTAGS